MATQKSNIGNGSEAQQQCPLPHMHEISLGDQQRRRHLDPSWEPAGFDRYGYQQALLREMSVIGGGINEAGNGNGDRYRCLSTPLEVDNPIGK